MVALDHRRSFQRLLARTGVESGEQRRADAAILVLGGGTDTEAQRAIGQNLLAVVEAFGSIERIPEGPC